MATGTYKHTHTHTFMDESDFRHVPGSEIKLMMNACSYVDTYVDLKYVCM